MTTDRRRRGPVDAALDLVLFAPLGMLASCRDLVPEMAAKGRHLVDQQVSNARVVGRLVVNQGRSRIGATNDVVADDAFGAAVADAEADAEFGSEPMAQRIPVRLEAGDGSSDGDGSASGDGTDLAVGSAELAIPQYDSLAASQVVARLDGLTPRELDAVRQYELAHRGRKTVLGKIDQLRRL